MDEHDFDEIWVEAGSGASMCALIRDDVGWLMYLRSPTDSGFSSRNHEYVGAADARTLYELSNGQRDEYPTAWALPLPTVMRALEHFKRTGLPPPFVLWHNDSGDGESFQFLPDHDQTGQPTP